MSAEEKLVEKARVATSDQTIFDVALLQPMGIQKAMAAGTLIGGAVGGVSGNAGSFGRLIGLVAGSEIAKRSSELPSLVCLALTPTELYLLDATGGWKFDPDVTPYLKIERSNLGVSVNKKLTRSEVTLQDTTTGVSIQLEALPLNPYDNAAFIKEIGGKDE